MDNRIIVTYGENVRKIVRDVLEKADLNGMIPSNSNIGIKPNLVVSKPSSSGATTSPEMVSALIEYLKEHGHNNIVILESSWLGDSTTRAFKVCGYEDVSQKYGVPLFDIKKDTYSVRTYKGTDIEVSDKVLGLDFLINMPVLKGHCQTYITCALKNLKGCIPDREKRRFHTMGLHRPIAYLNKIIKSDFILVDGLCGDLDFEEGGNPVKMNRIICGTDPVLIDSYVAAVMGYKPEDIEYIKTAAEIGVGSCDIKNAEVIVIDKDTSLAAPPASRKVQQLAEYIDEKEACSACYGNLIQALARLNEKGLLKGFKKKSIKIGQGYKDCNLDGIGVGICTSGLGRNVKGCPPSTGEILEFLKNTGVGSKDK